MRSVVDHDGDYPLDGLRLVKGKEARYIGGQGEGIADGEELAHFANNATYLKDADNDKLTGYSCLGVGYGGQEATNGTDFNLCDTDQHDLDDWNETPTCTTNARNVEG